MTLPPSAQVQAMSTSPARRPAFVQAWPHAGFLWRGMVNQGHWRSVLGGLAMGVLAVLLVPRFAPVSVGFMLGMACGFLAFLLWWTQVEGLMQQNRPMLARLVPGHVAALRRSLRQQWLLHTLGWTLVCAIATQWQHAPFIASGIGLVLFTLVWLVRQPWLWLLAGFGFPAALLQLPALRSAATDVAGDRSTAVLLSVVLLLVLGFLVPLALQTGHAAHRARAARRERLIQMSRAMSTGSGVPVRLQVGLLGGLQGVCERPWRWLLQASLRPGVRPGVRPASLGHLNLVLAGSAHWARQAGVLPLLILIFGLPLLLVPLLMEPGATSKVIDPLRFGLCIALYGVALNPVMQLAPNWLARRQEQGLLLLTPGVPHGAALALACPRYLAAQFVVGWLLITALVMSLMQAYASLAAQNYAAGYAAGCLPLLALVWRDWARLRPSAGGMFAGSSHATAPMIVGSVSGGLCQLVELLPAVSLGASLLLTGVLVGVARWRWQQAQRGRRNRSPWPVGRV
jgi:hypothetical protein